MQASLIPDQLREAFRLEHASALITDAGPDDTISVTELRSDARRPHLSDPIDAERATMVCVHLRDIDSTQVWQDGWSDGRFPVSKGACTVHDLRGKLQFHHAGAFHILAFILPGKALDRQQPGAPREPVKTMRAAASRPVDDKVLFGLTNSLLPFMNGSVKANQKYIEHALRAAAVHLRGADEVEAPRRRILRGGLAPWQQQRARDLLRRHLVEGISLDAVAAACRLSKSAFLRAFRESFGVPPHQWLLRCRVEQAAELMRDPALALSEIAVASGFFDQSHFTRAFSQRMGLSPGAWRRAQPARSADPWRTGTSRLVHRSER